MSGTPLSPRAAVALGLVFIAAGTFVVLLPVGAVPGVEPSLQAPSWVGVCAGLMFALCGGAIIIGYAVAGGAGPDGDLLPGTPRWVRAVQYLLGLGIVGALAAIATWIAVGPGPRAFTLTIPFVGRGPGDETVGRVVFGAGAVLMWAFLVVFLAVGFRRLRRD